MQALMVMYVPTYRKSVITDGWYALRGFTKVTACVHSNDPFAVVWRSLDAIQYNHAVRFEAGDKTTYLTLGDKDTTTPRNIFNVKQQNLVRHAASVRCSAESVRRDCAAGAGATHLQQPSSATHRSLRHCS